MNTYANLPLAQRRTQQMVDRFNAAEELWRALEIKRRCRRARYPEMPPEFHSQLDLLDLPMPNRRRIVSVWSLSLNEARALAKSGAGNISADYDIEVLLKELPNTKPAGLPKLQSAERRK